MAEEESSRKFFYFGEDEGYWDSLKKRFERTYAALGISYEAFERNSPEEIQNLVSLCYREKPKAIFIDYTKNENAMLHLGRILATLNFINPPVIVGLIDFQQHEAVQRNALTTGVFLIHKKNSEVDAVVYDTICFAFHEALEQHGFAQAKLKDDANAFIPCKLNEIRQTGARIESNVNFQQGEEFFLSTFWQRKGMIKTPLSKLVNQSESSLYYHNYTYTQEVYFELVPPFEASDDISPELLAEKEAKRERDLADCHERMDSWIEANQKRAHPKFIKVLAIDKELRFLFDSPSTDVYPFVLHCQPFLIEVKKELIKLKPDLISFAFQELSEEDEALGDDVAFTFNDSRTLQFIIKVIKSIPDYNPFILIFGYTQHKTDEMQSLLDYKQLLVNSEDPALAPVIKMATLLEKKYHEKIKAEGKDKERGPSLILDKTHPSTYAEIVSNIKLVSLSETDAYFQSDIPFKPGDVIRINQPIKMHLCVAELPKDTKATDVYYGLVMAMTEELRKELRKFVNSVFFRVLESEKERDRQEAAALKQEVIRKKKEAAEALAQAKLEAETRAKEEEQEEARKEAEKATAQKMYEEDE